MIEPKIFSKTEALEMVKKAVTANNNRNRIFLNKMLDPNNEANRLCEAKRKEFTEAEIKRRVKEEVKTEREALTSHIDKLTISYQELTGLGDRIKSSYDGLMLELNQLRERKEDINKVCETLIELTANVSGLTTTLDKAITRLEKGKTTTDRSMLS